MTPEEYMEEFSKLFKELPEFKWDKDDSYEDINVLNSVFCKKFKEIFGDEEFDLFLKYDFKPIHIAFGTFMRSTYKEYEKQDYFGRSIPKERRDKLIYALEHYSENDPIIERKKQK